MKWKKFGAIAVAGVLACSALCLSPFKPSAEAVDLMQDTFETGYGSWKGVGSTITITSDEAHGGTKSLYVHDRTASWGAPRCSMTGILAAGKTYEFQASAMFPGSGSQQFALKMIYTDSSGTDHYDNITYKQANAGEWVTLSGSYTVPNGATGMILYVELPGANTDQGYYIDDVLVRGKRPPFSSMTNMNPTLKTAPHKAGTAVAVQRLSALPNMHTAEPPAYMFPAEHSFGTVQPAALRTSWKPAVITK